MNIGEWSEFYAFLKILEEGKIVAANENLQKIDDIFYPVIKIIRERNKDNCLLFYIIKKQHIIVVEANNGNELANVPIAEFGIQSSKLLSALKKGEKSRLNDADIDDFIASIGSPKIKEKSSSKRDITLTLHDIKTGYTPDVGFSIKSNLGSASTLFNANISTNITYTVQNTQRLSADEKDLQTKPLVKALVHHHCNIQFDEIPDDIFASNLQMIDSQFPLILSEMLKLYYSGYSNKVAALTEKVAELNPCGFSNTPHFPFYEHKMKNFLSACALGMTSKKPWNGSFDASGGYIIVKDDGEIVCYHIYNWNNFQDYLYNNTFIDTPSTTRHKFGTLKDDKITLNFQVRFL